MSNLVGQITVTTDELRNQSSVVKTKLEEMRGRFDDLEQLIRGTSSYWTGEAAENHRAMYQTRKANIEEILARYQEHVTDLQVMAGVYEQGEQAAQNAADSLQISNLD